jgi:homeobox protein cut-like
MSTDVEGAAAVTAVAQSSGPDADAGGNKFSHAIAAWRST